MMYPTPHEVEIPLGKLVETQLSVHLLWVCFREKVRLMVGKLH